MPLTYQQAALPEGVIPTLLLKAEKGVPILPEEPEVHFIPDPHARHETGHVSGSGSIEGMGRETCQMHIGMIRARGRLEILQSGDRITGQRKRG